mmetsp:Transcript_44272/g.118111  ORF Transcript_44272/g.118111 Transcript_44272/m.118111 type:complete len:227 (-) Transcript_44272:571-1251(-)|eukprot:CAMPEP_0113726820 /NCGR_PEP_ID=MMETSP0038_2-20120614/40699_1 /TAXON_ID=2898 /ORGANISM="Cryptomonas paramecium" /LENGTH=226 /DNA_ID=CAMNT_0000657579 /DNA_START=186 /DNA_END=866 /DNA_ORIENTATION=+ /assembly_acc=CAM_ASM_000170
MMREEAMEQETGCHQKDHGCVHIEEGQSCPKVVQLAESQTRNGNWLPAALDRDEALKTLTPINETSTRAKLSKEQVHAILNLKRFKGTGEGTERITTHRLARRLGVSEKTIRDIWNGRTWRDQINEALNQNFTTEIKIEDGQLPSNRSVRISFNHRCDSMKSKSSKDVKLPSSLKNGGSPKPNTLKPKRKRISAVDCSRLEDLISPLPDSTNPDDPFHDDWPFPWH